MASQPRNALSLARRGQTISVSLAESLNGRTNGQYLRLSLQTVKIKRRALSEFGTTSLKITMLPKGMEPRPPPEWISSPTPTTPCSPPCSILSQTFTVVKVAVAETQTIDLQSSLSGESMDSQIKMLIMILLRTRSPTSMTATMAMGWATTEIIFSETTPSQTFLERLTAPTMITAFAS